ncbi:MAG: nucleotide exchange factor GrpE [candidate division KSB1 bacterium]|nr:nucleotide exchange factor GrpE [candidate division KSB1 bacterium]
MVQQEDDVTRVAIDSGDGKTEREPAGEVIPVQVIDSEMGHRQDRQGEDGAQRYLEQLQRLQAEFINYRRRVERERSDFAAQGRREVLTALLPVLDDFDSLLGYHTTADDSVAHGLRGVAEKLQQVLAREGLQRFGQVGDRFDPELHEAVATAACAPDQEGMVVEVWRPGYLVDGKVLRAAKVKVGRAEPNSQT